MDSLERKITIAGIVGTWQSTLTNFPYLRKVWQDNTVEERLLGVSITGIYDCPLINDPDEPNLPDRLRTLKEAAIESNRVEASNIGISASVAVTAIKPEGTVSQLVTQQYATASGLHPQHSKYFYRRVRGDLKDPLSQFLMQNGVPFEPCVMRPESTVVFTFPMASPEGALTRDEVDAIKHLKLWLQFQRHYCEHKPSVTINVREHEWPAVGSFVWEHFDEMSGVSFLPYDGGSYRQAPYEECTLEEYQQLYRTFPKHLDWDSMKEETDNVEGAQMLACTANGCAI